MLKEELIPQEAGRLRCQFGTSKTGRDGRRNLSYALIRVEQIIYRGKRGSPRFCVSARLGRSIPFEVYFCDFE